MRAGKPGASSRARDGGLLMEHLLKWGHSKEVGRQGGLGTLTPWWGDLGRHRGPTSGFIQASHGLC